MTPTARLRTFTLYALGIFLGALFLSALSLPSLIGMTATATSGTVPGDQPAAKRSGCPSCQDNVDADKPHLLAASYYSLGGNLSATLMLNNKGPLPLDVRPTLFSLGGERLDLPPVIVEGKSFREIDLSQYGLAGTPFEQGSIQVFHRGKDLVLGAQIKMVDRANSLIFDEKLVELATEFKSQRLEGVWWLPSHRAEASLVLSNTSEAPLSVTARIEGIVPKLREPVTINLMPHQSRTLDLQRDVAGANGGTLEPAGGLSLEHSGPAGALLARMVIQDAAAGYSSWVRFHDPTKAKSTKLHGAGLRLGMVAGEKLTPIVVARNVGNSETTVSGRIPYTAADGTTGVVSLPVTQLAPGEAKVIDAKASIKRSGVERIAATAGLEFEYTGEPGTVLMTAQSVSQSRNQVFAVPLWDIAAQRSSTGGYPWTLDGGTTTVVYLKNVTDRVQKYALELRTDGTDQPYVLGVKTIEPHQTVALDLRRLRDERVPDERGRTLSAEAVSGQVHWSVRSADRLPMIGRAEQVNIEQGLSSSYACQNCCQDSFAFGYLSPDLIATLPGSINQFLAQEIYETCYGGYSSPNFVYGANWWSNNEAVMAVDWAGLGTAVGLGGTEVNSSWEAYEYYFPPNESGNPNEIVECQPIVVLADAAAPAEVITLRISVPNSPTRDFEVSPTLAGVVAGETVNIIIEAVDQNGVVVCRNISFTTSTSRPIHSSETGLPSNFTLDCGRFAGTMMLNRVAGTERGTTYRFRLSTDGSTQDFEFFTYFRVHSTDEGLEGHTTACGNVIKPNDHFVALPVRGLCDQKVQVRNPVDFRLDATVKKDVGPHFGGPSRCDPSGETQDPYWNTGTRPRVEQVDCEAGNNNSGIDLATGTYVSLGRPSQVIWRFD